MYVTPHQRVEGELKELVFASLLNAKWIFRGDGPSPNYACMMIFGPYKFNQCMNLLGVRVGRVQRGGFIVISLSPTASTHMKEVPR